MSEVLEACSTCGHDTRVVERLAAENARLGEALVEIAAMTSDTFAGRAVRRARIALESTTERTP